MADNYSDEYYDQYWMYDEDIPEPAFPSQNVKRKVSVTANPHRRRRYHYPR